MIGGYRIWNLGKLATHLDIAQPTLTLCNTLAVHIAQHSYKLRNTTYSLRSMGYTYRVRSIGCIGGADRTFACKSQECLWKDWYIYYKF